MIVLHQFPRIGKIPNASPFCLKVETYLRMAGLDYEIKWLNNPGRGPKGKLPYINFNGQILADSELIFERLEADADYPLSGFLTEEQKAEAVFIDTALSERLFWVIIFLRWKDDENFAHIKRSIEKGIPYPMKWIVPKMIRRYIVKGLYMQGMGRHSRQEVIALGSKLIDKLAVALGDKQYMLDNTRPSWLDASMFGFLVNVIFAHGKNELKDYTRTHQNLFEYIVRLWEKYYPEMPVPTL